MDEKKILNKISNMKPGEGEDGRRTTWGNREIPLRCGI